VNIQASLRPALLPLAAVLTIAIAPARAAEPGKDEPGTVHINAIKNPERYTYRAVAAGLDKFDQLHELAPAVEQLRFRVEARRGKALEGEPLAARIAADDFSIPLTLDQDLRFSVPRSQAAYDARAELVLNRKKYDARFDTWVRTPGLADNQFRMGDVRLDCQVKIAIAKEEMPFWANALINGILLTTDWCSWFKGATPKGDDRSWSREAAAKLSAATLRDGGRSLALKVSGKTFGLPIGDTNWSNDAIVELEYAPGEPTPPAELTAQAATAAQDGAP
jgi:hypothetical protein